MLASWVPRRGITSVLGWPRHLATQLGSGTKHGGAGQRLAQSPWATAAAAPAHSPMLPEARYPEQICMVLATTGRILTHEYRACNVRKLLSRARALMDEEHLRREDFEVQLPLLPLHFLSISHLLHHSFFQLFSPSPAFLDSIPSHHCDPPGRWRNTAQRRQRESLTPGTSKSTTKSFRLCAKLFAQA